MMTLKVPNMSTTAGARFSRVLDYLEREKGMTQDDVARFLGKAQPRISNYAHDERPRFSRKIRSGLEKMKDLGINPEFFDDDRRPMLLRDVRDVPSDLPELKEALLQEKSEKLDLKEQLLIEKRKMMDLEVRLKEKYPDIYRDLFED